MLEKFIEYLSANPGVLIAGVLACVEIVPIKINPIRWILTKIGDVLTGDLRKELQEVKDELRDTKVQNWRWNVLDFANSCKNGRRHTEAEWHHAIGQLTDYERYIEKHDISNGVFEEDAKYLRRSYQEHCDENDFL